MSLLTAGEYRRRAAIYNRVADQLDELETLEGGRVAPAAANGHPGRKRGRPPGRKNKPAKAEKPAAVEAGEKKRGRGRRAEGGSLKDVILGVLGRYPKRGIGFEDLVKAVHEAGYRSNADHKGFVQNIRTTLSVLKKDKKISKSADKRFFLGSELPAEAAEPAAEAKAG